LAGQIAGVKIVQGAGAPGTSSQIQVRGVSTLTAGTSPLLVIDGFPSDNLNLSDINPNDIESLQVLKDASSASIYGSRGSNGVVIVTTKKGSDKMNVNINSYYGVQQVTTTFKMADAYQWAKYQTNFFRQRNIFGANDAPASFKPYLNGTPGLVNTDWQKELFKAAPIQDHQLTVSGGTKDTHYYFSGDYFDQTGIVVGSAFNRYSFRANIESTLFKNEEAKVIREVKFGVNFSPTFTTTNAIPTGSHNNDAVILTGLFAYPNFRAYNPDGSLALSEQIRYRNETNGGTGAGFENPVAIATLRENVISRSMLLGTTYLDFEIIKGLNFKTSLGVNQSFEQSDVYRPSALGKRNVPPPTVATAASAYNKILNILNENTLVYTTSFSKDHHIEALAGYTYQTETSTSNYVAGQKFVNDAVHTLNAAGQITSGSSYQERWALLSLLGRINYNYKEKYLASLAVRNDGSSRFGSANKWGLFPSVSVGWRVSEEAFFASLLPVITDLKVRASYGRTGNNLMTNPATNQITNYGYAALMGAANYPFSNILTNGLSPTTAPNKKISWENKEQFDAGLDIGLFKNNLQLTIDYYNSLTDGLLLNVSVPSQSGYITSLQNIGKVLNRGIEATITANAINLGKVKWSPAFNITANRNKVVALATGIDKITSALNITRVGHPIGEYYLYNITGVFNTQDEINSTPHYSTDKPGDYIYEDVNKDGKIDSNDRKPFGSSFPSFVYGFTNTFSWNGFDLNVVMQGSQGGKLYNYTRTFLLENGSFANVLSERVEGAWKSPQDRGNGYASAGSFDKNLLSSNFGLEDASYLRIRNITFGYTLPKQFAKRIRMERLRVYASSLNPFTFTKYRGYNPEASASTVTSGSAAPLVGATGNPMQFGIDWGNYPLPKSLILGVNITF